MMRNPRAEGRYFRATRSLMLCLWATQRELDR